MRWKKRLLQHTCFVMIRFTGDMLGKIMILLLRNSDFENASLVMNKLIHQHQKIVGVPSFDALELFVDHCIINKVPSRAIVSTDIFS